MKIKLSARDIERIISALESDAEGLDEAADIDGAYDLVEAEEQHAAANAYRDLAWRLSARLGQP